MTTRRAATNDTAFNHNLDDILNEEYSSEESDDEAPETKNQYFEFSNSHFVMRFVKLVFYVQTVAVLVDHPALEWPVFFETFCRGILFYSLRFYSRPVLDVLYVVQSFWKAIVDAIAAQNLSDASRIEATSGRRLNVNPYREDNSASFSSRMQWNVDFLDPHHWHSTTHFAHYLLTILFVVVSVAFTFRFWEISDYSNREEVKRWLERYVADGWWRKGAFDVVSSLAKIIAAMALFFLVLSAITNNFTPNALTNGTILWTIVIVVACVVGLAWLFGFLGIRIVEAAFVRYVSQNVAYTSAIILKRAVKAKFDFGLICLCSLFVPAIYTLLQSLLLYTDWNDTLAPDHRKGGNFVVPCYFMAFPPYRAARDADSCPVQSSMLSSQRQPPEGYYFRDDSILQCDSYTGIALYVVSATFFTYLLLGYAYVFLSMIDLVVREFKSSKWVDVLEKLIRIRDEEEKDYRNRFPWYSVAWIKFVRETKLQAKHFYLAFIWVFVASFAAVKSLFTGALSLLRFLLKPFEFFGGRLLLFAIMKVRAWINPDDPSLALHKKHNVRERMNSLRTSSRSGTPTRSSRPLSGGSSRGSRRRVASKSDIMKSHNTGVSHDVLLDDSSMHDGEDDAQDDKSFKLGTSTLGGERPVERANSSSSEAAQNNNVLGIGIDHEFAEYTPNLEDSAPLFSLSMKLNKSMKMMKRNLNVVKHTSAALSHCAKRSYKYFLQLSFVTYFRVKLGMFVSDTFNKKQEDGVPKYGLSSFGAHAAPWRRELTLNNKTRVINRLRHHVVLELRMAKLLFVSDHDLVIGFMDRTVDSAGLFTLAALYSYEHMYWFLVVLLEMALYPLVGAVFTQNFYWQDRNLAFIIINVFFGVLTYSFSPHTEDIDRWFEFCGRMLVGTISVGLIIAAQSSGNVKKAHVPMFQPWKAWAKVNSMLQSRGVSSAETLVDVIMTAYFFAYTLYVLYAIGVFGALHRMWKAFKFSYHDHILDFVVEKAEEKTFGLENVFSGLLLVQQWDDIIKSQRRYALLTWPDVRPGHLMPLSAKIMEVKWASFFNLTLKNIRSSLGLTILHATMFAAEEEVTRWIVHANGELLQVADSQNDTPITIALKECAYYLLCYGEQNEGKLDDGTSFDDDAFADYYPEVEELRDELYSHGEFIKEFSVEYYITSEDLIKIRDEGRYDEPSKLNYGSAYDDQGIPLTLEFPENAVLPNQARSKGQAVITWEQREEKRVLEQAKKKEKMLQSRQRKERLSLHRHRFPEDTFFRNFESGQESAWRVICFDVPDDNVFLDSHLIKRMITFPDFHYASMHTRHEDFVRANRKHHVDEREDLEEGHGLTAAIEEDKKDGENEDFPATSEANTAAAELLADDDSSHKFSALTDPDLQYIVPSAKKAHRVTEEAMIVPLNDPKLQQFADFDRRSENTRNNSNRWSFKSDHSGNKTSNKQRQSIRSNFSSETKLFPTILRRTAAESERDIRFKICNFAAILLSSEIAEACKDLKWSIADFKAFNKLASKSQGKVAQHLAYACHLNAPDGFVRVSDWSRPENGDAFDENPETDLPMIVRGIVNVVQGVESAIDTTAAAVTVLTEWHKLLTLPLSSGGQPSRRSSRRNSQRKTISLADLLLTKGENEPSEANVIENGVLCDRIVHFLAEALVCSTEHLVLDDCELSHNGRRAWRAIVRALRLTHSSFVTPTMFTSVHPIRLLSLELPRNDLDCGDCVYIADILVRQRALRRLDLSFNRIGGRGLARICKALREHKEIIVCKFDHNNIGPGAAQDIGLFLKQTRSLRCLDLSGNHLGEIVRYPTLYSREKIPSAAKFICLGLRSNKSIEQLDLSNNHLGETLATFLPLAVNKHPRLHTLNVSGNDLGAVHGSNLLFALAGAPLGAKYAREKEEFIRIVQHRQMMALKEKEREREKQAQSHGLEGNQGFNVEGILTMDSVLEGEDANRALSIAENNSLFADTNNASKAPSNTLYLENSEASQSSSQSERGSPAKKQRPPTMITNLGQSFQDQLARLSQPAVGLTSLSVADNQLGAFTGHAIAAVLDKVRGLTHVDISGNALGPQGAEIVTDQIELLFGIRPREFIKIVLFDIEEKRYTGHNAKVRKKVYTNLCSLQMARNNVGPRVLSSLAHILQNPNCGIVDLDISLNPVGLSHSVAAGNAAKAAVDLRNAMLHSQSLVSFNLHKTSLLPTELVTIFGGMSHHETIQTLILSHTPMDEPACLQLGNVIEHCPSLTHLDLSHCRMGANGGIIIAQKANRKHTQLKCLDLSHNSLGPIAGVYLAEGLQASKCAYLTLRVAGNDFFEDGGLFLAKALVNNAHITCVDLSSNHLTSAVGEYLADAVRGQFKNGEKVKDSAIRTFIVNDNPQIGLKSARMLVRSLSNHHVEHVEIRNIGAGSRTAEAIGDALRDIAVAWRYLDVSENSISRTGMNQIFWAARHNRRLRVLRISLNPVGSVFCSNGDALLTHGISVPVTIRENSVLRELDLSFLALNSEAGINIIDAVIDNHTLKRLSLRGNQLDDNVALMLPDLFRCNNVLEELDLSHNRLGFASAFAIAESLDTNRSLKKLFLEYNRFGGSGSATLDAFARSIMMNYSLQVLFLDGNKLGPEWGIRLSEAFVRNNVLTQVSLRDNRLDSRSGEALLKAFAHCPYLLELAVTADEIGNKVYDEFRRVFSRKRASIRPDSLVEETVITTKQNQLLSSYNNTK